MSDSDSALSFIRQRRDLFVISALLSVSQLAHFRVNETLALFGASITVGNPQVLTFSLWVLWAYWMLRYIQFFLREKAIDKIRNVIFERVKTPLAKRAAILFQRNHSINVFQPIDSKVSRNICIEADGGMQVELPVRVFEGIRIHLYNNNGMNYRYLVPRGEYIGCVFFKLPHFVLIDTEFTDYIFPFLFAITPLIVFLSQS
ncbi:MAG: hypothetical protein Q7U94_10630 [Sideroxyarcus sp.]|nr:hypothetical protein [Sideroxyarcus sp.]